MKTTKTTRVQGGERKLAMMIILYLISSRKAKNKNKLWTWSWRKCWNEEDKEDNEATDAEYNGSECEKYTVNEANEDKGGENRKENNEFCRKLRNIINKP